MEQSRTQVQQTVKPQQTLLESDVEGDSILSRYQRTKEALDSLKMRLAAEREQLARERFQTSSLYVIASNTNVNYSGYNSYGLPYSYSAPANWNSPESFTERSSENAKDQKETQTEVREHLKKIEKICDEELGRMERSISNLRKVRRFWNNLDFYRPYSVYAARDYRYTENPDNPENAENNAKEHTQKKASMASFSRGFSRNSRRHKKRPNSRTTDDVSDERRQYIETCKQHMKVIEQTKFMIE